MSPGPWQIVIIALIILLLFGASRLSDIGKGLGEGIRNFKKGLSEDDEGAGEDKDKAKQLGEKAKASEEPAKDQEEKRA